jgi:sulfur carrier protein ThiS
MKVLYVNNDGAGFADYLEIEPQTTVKAFFSKHCRGEPSSYLIRVNRQPVASDYVLQADDRITITPTKIEGAA